MKLSTSTTTTLLLLTTLPLISAHPATTNSSKSTTNTAGYTLQKSYTAPTFFDNFNFFTGPDPTHGHVIYTDRAHAATSNYAAYHTRPASKDTTAYIGVNTTPLAPNGRESVRLIGKDAFNAGSMIVFDVRHIPVQWGVWPAIWLLGKDGTWPQTGESDVLEYVHRGQHNAMTLHTAPGCSVSNSSSNPKDGIFSGNLVHADCNTDDATTGCSISAPKDFRIATAGDAFNKQGGGVYVHDWTADGISVYLFPRNALPADLVAGKPDSATWKQKPLARFAGSGCDFEERFKNMNIIINIDFCGDWAGKDKVWQESGAQKATGAATCKEYVANNGGDFKESFFEIGGIQVYGKGK
ncbi:unnamed protein product [Zymoseptoria tritici ST99CH_3D7]|uniref:GH16 domain-containing protein n=1 Tax=Zymoseptoria tritici (strain ST99CH_3D7) TaxID=1276538 RepID=A0A1X7S724_ZYMT9|nr:unnamed protein product [Zymoseptoria tritici ST99CH_3D7]